MNSLSWELIEIERVSQPRNQSNENCLKQHPGATLPGRGRGTAIVVSLAPKLNHSFYINQSQNTIHPTIHLPINHLKQLELPHCIDQDGFRVSP